MKKLNYFLVIFFLLKILIVELKAQDAHLSQFDAAPAILNPALAGMDERYGLRGVSQFRNQWGSPGQNLSTAAIAFDMPYEQDWGIGAYLINDDGAQFLNTFKLVGGGAYRITQPNQKDIKLTVGLQMGIIYKSTRDSKLLFDSQYRDGAFDPDIPSGEIFEKNGKVMPEINMGFKYDGYYSRDKINPYAGFAIMHCTNPKESFLESDNSRLPLRYVFHGGSRFFINDEFYVDPKFLVMKQRSALEIVGGCQGVYTPLNTMIKVHAGVYYRNKDAVVNEVGFSYNNFTYKICYDISTNPLKTYTKGKNGLEFSIAFAEINKRKGSKARF